MAKPPTVLDVFARGHAHVLEAFRCTIGRARLNWNRISLDVVAERTLAPDQQAALRTRLPERYIFKGVEYRVSYEFKG